MLVYTTSKSDCINQYRYISLFLYPHLKFDFNVWHEWDPPMSTKQNNYQWHGEDIAENGTENQTKTNTSYTFLSFYHHLQCASRVSLSFPVSTFSFTFQVPPSNFYFHWYWFCSWFTVFAYTIRSALSLSLNLDLFISTFLILRWFDSFHLSLL